MDYSVRITFPTLALILTLTLTLTLIVTLTPPLRSSKSFVSVTLLVK